MKSFFKKLAFVMALAMVVSMAAPVAASAATPLNAAFQNTNTFVTELEMEVGQKIDLCFKGAPKGWRELNRGWKVTSGDAVTVDNDGWVTAVKEGKATIEFFMEGCESAVVDIVVGEEEVALVNYGQTSTKTVKLMYTTGDFSKIEAKDVKLYRVFKSANGLDEVAVAWPVKTVIGNAKGEVYVTPYVAFQDGVNYRVVVNGVEDNIVGVKPTVDEISYIITMAGATTDEDGVLQGDAYVTEEGEEEVETKLAYKVIYLHNGVEMDVTNEFKDGSALSVEYVLESPTEDDEASEYVNLYTDSIVFFGKYPTVVNAVATWADDEGKEFSIDCYPAFLEPQAFPEYELSVTEWAFHKTGNTTFTWAKDSFTAQGDLDYWYEWNLVLEIKDNRGNAYVTNEEVRAILNAGISDVSKQYKSMSELALNGYTFEVFSTSTDDFLIDAQNFTVTTWKKLNDVAFYVDLTKVDEETGEALKPETIYADTFNVLAPAYYAAIRPNSNTITLVADAEQDMSSVTTGEIYISKYNQHYEVLAEKYNYITVTCSNKDVEEGTAFSVNGDKIVINGPALYKESGYKTSFTFTVKCNSKGYTTSFKVNLVKPKWVAADAIVTGQEDNYVNGYVFASTEKQIALDRYSAYAWDGTENVKKYYNKLAFAVDAPAISFVQDTDNPDAFSKKATVYLYNTSGSQKVTYANEENYILVNDKEWNSATDATVVDSIGNTRALSVGDKVVALEKNHVVVEEEDGLYKLTQDEDNKAKFNVALTIYDPEYDNTVVSAKKGTYDFVVYTVTSIKVDTNGNKVVTYKTESKSFNVDYALPSVALHKRAEYTTEFKASAITHNVMKQIIVDNFDFTLGGAAWDIDTSVVLSVYYTVEGNHVYIEGVFFGVPVDGDKSKVSGEDYYTNWVDIDMSIELAK